MHEKTVSLHALESENTSKESNMRSEVANTAQMVATLKDELERRLKDLVQLREERDALAVSDVPPSVLKWKYVFDDAVVHGPTRCDWGQYERERGWGSSSISCCSA